MPIDLSIWQNYLRPPKSIQEYDNEYAQANVNALATQHRQMQIGELQRQQADDLAYKQAARSFGSDVDANYNALFRAGLPSQAQAYQKATLEGKEKMSKINKESSDILDAGIKRYRDQLGYVESPEGAARWYQAQYADPVVGKFLSGLGTIDQALQEIPRDPAQFKQWRDKTSVSMESYAKYLKDLALAGKANHEAIGEAMKNSRIGLEGITTPEQYVAWHEANHRDPILGPYLQSRGITVDQARDRISQAFQTPGGFAKLLNESKLGIEKAYANVIASGQLDVSRGNLQVSRDRLALDKQQPKGQIVQSDEGPMLVDPRSGTGRPITGPTGAPLPGQSKPLNDSQSKALLFGSRAQAAHKVLEDLAAKSGVSVSIPGSRLPIVGGVINAAQGANQQSLDQAKRDFMTAVLRRESGASISPTEFDTADKQYFPQVGDSEKVIKQKAANRQLVINGLLAEVPEKQRNSMLPVATQDSSDLHSKAEAIIRGGK